MSDNQIKAELTRKKLMAAIDKANDALSDASWYSNDPEHYIREHADTLPETFRIVAKSVREAVEALQEIIHIQIGG
jgi:hypothetical protein